MICEIVDYEFKCGTSVGELIAILSKYDKDARVFVYIGDFGLSPISAVDSYQPDNEDEHGSVTIW